MFTAVGGARLEKVRRVEKGSQKRRSRATTSSERPKHPRDQPAAPPELLASLKQQCSSLGRTLHTDAVALAARGLINGGFTAQMNSKTLAFELLGLGSLLRNNWHVDQLVSLLKKKNAWDIASRTAVQQSELDQAESLAEQLLSALGVQEQALASGVKQSEQRQRNFTLFVRAYAQVRRAIGYVCWDQNIDRIAPSLYAARRAGARKARARKASAVESTGEMPALG